jgi:hypothetical protein
MYAHPYALIQSSPSAVDLALVIQRDRHSLVEALGARDAAVKMLVDACHLVREKATVVDLLDAFNADLELRLCTASMHSLSLEQDTANTVLLQNIDSHAERELNMRRSLLVLSRSRQRSMETICSDQCSAISSTSPTLHSRDASFSTVYESEASDSDSAVLFWH